jgi:hypothetical protein
MSQILLQNYYMFDVVGVKIFIHLLIADFSDMIRRDEF